MNFYCKCTDKYPDFVGALLFAPPAPSYKWRKTPVWVCHDCFEHLVCNDYPIAVTRDSESPPILPEEAE